MAFVDFSGYAKQDVDVPYYVGKGKNRFAFTQIMPREKLQFRRYEIYPFGKDDFISGLVASGDILVELPSPTKQRVTFDFISYSGGFDEGLKVRGFNADGKYIGYCILPKRVEASVRRVSLELPGVKLVYLGEKREYQLVSVYVDQEPKRKLSDIREISDLPAYLTPEGRLNTASLRRNAK